MKIFFRVILSLLLFSQLAFSQLREIRQWQKVLPTITDSTIKNNALNRLSQLMSNRNPDSSYYYVRQAKNMAVGIGYKKGIADANKNYGVLLTGDNIYLSANYLNTALEQYRDLGDKEGESMTLMNLANLMYSDRDSTNAHAYLLKSYRVAHTVPKDSVLSIIINNINFHGADFNSPHFISPERDSLFTKGSLIAKKYNDDRMVLYYKLYRDYRLWSSGKKSEAITLLTAALKSADSIGNEYLKLSVYAQLSLRTDTDRAISYFKKGLNEATVYHFPAFRLVFANNLYFYLKARHQDAEAIKYADIVWEARDRQAEDLQNNGFSVVNFVKKDTDLKAVQEKAKTRTLLLVVFAGVAVMAVALLFFVYRSNRANKRYAIAQKLLADRTRSQNRELENWNRFHDMLLSVLAHDLRQPFSAIIMTSELMKFTNKALTEEELQTIVLDLNDTASKSIELLEGLLLWVKSKKENFEYKTQPILLQDNIAEANGLYTYDQLNKGIILLNDVPEKLVIDADKQMLLFINRNLISNATKYSPQGGTIRIQAEITDSEVIVSFSDQGPGMTAEQIQRLFVINENTRPGDMAQGAGVALSVCFDMIKQMNGRLWAEAEPGKGSAFFYAIKTANKK